MWLVRKALALLVIVLLGLSPMLVTEAQAKSKPLRFTLSPTSGNIASIVKISGSVTAQSKIPITGDNVTFFLGSNSTQIASAIVHPTNATYGTFNASFDVPLVDSGNYTIFANDSLGTKSSQQFTVTYGVNNLISTLKELQTDQNRDYSNFTAIMKLINQLEFTDQGLNNQLSSVTQSISSLSTSVSNSNSNTQPLYPLLIVFVALEGLLVGMVVVLIILFVRKKSPGTRPFDVEVFDS